MSRSASSDKAGGASQRLVGLGLLGAFFISGGCGLIHETAWIRLLRLVMGNTTVAITTVLTAFMGGLALGSYLGGRIIDKRTDPLRVFAVLEGLIGLFCLFLPWLIGAAEPLYRLIYQNTHATFYVFSLIRFLFCGLLLLLPAVFMGATLPVLTRFYAGVSDRIGLSVGKLYAINSFGAVLGACGTGFVLIPHLGVTATIRLACLLNLCVCVGALLLHRRTLGWPERTPGEPQVKRSAKASQDKRAAPEGVSYGRGALRVLLIGYALSGFAALVYEIAWSRALSLMIGSSVYAFSMMLTAFILGLATGSMLYARFVDRLRDPLRALALIEVAIGASALAVVPMFGKLPFFVTGLIARFGGSFWTLQAVEFALIVAIMLLPTLLMGAAFPLVARIFIRTPASAGRSVGTVYAMNTIGCIVGAFAAGFILIPVIGIQHTIFVAVWANVLIGCGFLALSRSLRVPLRAAGPVVIAVAVAAASALIPAWEPSHMSFGPFHMGRKLPKDIATSAESLQKLAKAAKILYHKEGLATTVTVKQTPTGDRILLVNGKPDASSSGDLHTQSLLAHVPHLLHPDPRSTLVIGLGSGITLGSSGLHPVERLDCAEISPAVVEASRYFDAFNYRILDDPRVRMLVADGRNHLALTARTYDVITSEPSNPWIAGIADLFTQEFFRLCRDRLNDRGVLCVWLQAYKIDRRAFTSIVHTFGSVFDNVTIWLPGGFDYLLIGVKGDFQVDVDALAKRIASEKIAADLKKIRIHSAEDFLSYLVMGAAAAGRLSRNAPLHTDDNALLEFSTPRNMYTLQGELDLRQQIEQFRQPDLAFLTGADPAAVEKVRRRAGDNIRARGLVLTSDVLVAQGRIPEAVRRLRRAFLMNPSDPWLRQRMENNYLTAGRYVRRGLFRRAAERYRIVLEINPNAVHALNDLAWIYATAPRAEYRDSSKALKLAERAVQLSAGKDAGMLDTLAAAQAASGRFADAVATAEKARALALSTGNKRLSTRLAQRIALYKSGKPYRMPTPK